MRRAIPGVLLLSLSCMSVDESTHLQAEAAAPSLVQVVERSPHHAPTSWANSGLVADAKAFESAARYIKVGDFETQWNNGVAPWSILTCDHVSVVGAETQEKPSVMFIDTAEGLTPVVGGTSTQEIWGNRWTLDRDQGDVMTLKSQGADPLQLTCEGARHEIPDLVRAPEAYADFVYAATATHGAETIYAENANGSRFSESSNEDLSKRVRESGFNRQLAEELIKASPNSGPSLVECDRVGENPRRIRPCDRPAPALPADGTMFA